MTEFMAICEYLDVTPKDFFDDTNPNPPLIEEILKKSKLLPDNDLLMILSFINRLLS